MSRRRLAALAAGAALVAGAGFGVLPAGAASPAPSTSASRLITFTRSGGLAGQTQRLIVSRARRITVTPHGKAYTLTRTQYQRLVNDLDRADLESLPRVMKPDHVVADGYVFTIAARGRTVRTETGAAVPARLQPLLNRLGALLRRATSG
jgi:hypothetical protein